MNTFNQKLKNQADKRKAKIREKFDKYQPITISEFARKYYPDISRSRVNALLKG